MSVLQGNASTTVDTTPLFSLVGTSAKGCATGYGGMACKDCIRPGYYRLGDRCLQCPQTPYAVITLFVLGFGTYLPQVQASVLIIHCAKSLRLQGTACLALASGTAHYDAWSLTPSR